MDELKVKMHTGSSDDGELNTGRGVAKRGDGFSVQETEGLLQEVRDRWQEGWDVIAQVHNAQFPGHKRTSGSLKRKFSKLYRMKVEAGTKEKHARAANLAKKVREEMRDQRRSLPGAHGLSEDIVADADGVGDLSEMEMITSQSTQSQPLADVVTAQHGTGLRDDAWQSAINRWPIAGERLRVLRTQIESSEPASSQDLVQTVLLVLLESQHQRDLEREQEREERRQEKQRWQEEIREERRRHEQERMEDRRTNDNFIQVMTALVAQLAASQQQRGGVN